MEAQISGQKRKEKYFSFFLFVSNLIKIFYSDLTVCFVSILFQLDHETEFEKQAREGMNDEESQFSVQMAIEPQAFVWSDKYRPRKPRFFNRVHTVSRVSFINNNKEDF